MHEHFCASLRREAYALLDKARLTIGQSELQRIDDPETRFLIVRRQGDLTTLVLDCVAEAMSLSESDILPERVSQINASSFPDSSGSLDTVAPQLEKLMVDAEALRARLRRLRSGIDDGVAAADRSSHTPIAHDTSHDISPKAEV
jgi:hypothetical protein